MRRIKKAQAGEKLKRSMPFSYKGKPQTADYSVDTSGYAAGKKKFPASIAYTKGEKPSWWKLGDSVETNLSKKNVDRLIKNKEPKGRLSDLKPKQKRSGGKVVAKAKYGSTIKKSSKKK